MLIAAYFGQSIIYSFFTIFFLRCEFNSIIPPKFQSDENSYIVYCDIESGGFIRRKITNPKLYKHDPDMNNVLITELLASRC